MSRSTILLIAALGIAAAATGAFVLGGLRTERARDQPTRSEVAPGTSDGGGAATPHRRAQAVGAPSPAAEAGADDPLAELRTTATALNAAAALREKARFPPTSRPIVNDVDPIVETRAVKERLSPPAQGRRPTLVVFSSALSYEAPNPIILFARFIREHPDDWSLRTDAEIAGELWNADDVVVAQVDFRDDGQERDLEAGDGIFTARLTPPAEDLARWNGLIRAQVYGETGDGERRKARTRFYYGVPSAKLTGYYRDELVDGHLRILAEIEVREVGEYRLEATLSGSRGLLAWAESTAALEPGVSMMPVTFWGLTLREANEPGPYRLSSIALANVTYKPPQLNDAIGTSYETAPYDPRDFSGEPYNDPKLLERAARYEARARGEAARAP